MSSCTRRVAVRGEGGEQEERIARGDGPAQARGEASRDGTGGETVVPTRDMCRVDASASEERLSLAMTFLTLRVAGPSTDELALTVWHCHSMWSGGKCHGSPRDDRAGSFPEDRAALDVQDEWRRTPGRRSRADEGSGEECRGAGGFTPVAE